MNVLFILASLSGLVAVLGGPIVSDNCNGIDIGVIIMLLSTEYYIPIMW